MPKKWLARLSFLSVAMLALVGCSAAPGPTPFPSPIPLATSTPRAGTTQSATSQPTAVSLPSSTPDPYAGLTIPDLASRSYGAGRIAFEPERRVSSRFTRYVYEYPSDGLTVHGFANVPTGRGPFPVVLVLHGYIDPDEYHTLTYTTTYADSLADAGFIVLHPNYRNYPPSEPGPNLFRVGYAVDVMNLVALVQQQAGEPGPLELADPSAIGLFGHSMGGGITLRTITANAPVNAAVLYGSMNADELLNFEKIYEWSDGERGLLELHTPPKDLARISPVNYLEDIHAAVSIHHGAADALVPPEWSDELCQRLTVLGKTVECFSYPGEPHTFVGFGGIQLIERSVAFFGKYLRAD